MQKTIIFTVLFLLILLPLVSSVETWKYNYLDQGDMVQYGGNYTINTNYSTESGHSLTSDYATTANFWDLLDTPFDLLLSMFSTDWIDTDVEMNNNDLVFANGAIQQPNYVQFNISWEDGQSEGRLQWNMEDGTLEFGLPGGDVNLQVGQEIVIRVKNEEAVTINNGEVVYASSAIGNVKYVKLANAANHTNAMKVVGVATEDIAPGDFGYITALGLVRDFDTSGFQDGQIVYLDTVDGQLIDTPPTAPNTTVAIGIVVRPHATEGIMYARISPTGYLTEVSDVYSIGLTDNSILQYNLTTERFEMTTNPIFNNVTADNLTVLGSVIATIFHSDLSNLLWSNAGHVMDTTLDMNYNKINNVVELNNGGDGSILIGDSSSGENRYNNNQSGGHRFFSSGVSSFFTDIYGSWFESPLSMRNNKISYLATPTLDYDATTKLYVDENIASNNFWKSVANIISPKTDGDTISLTPDVTDLIVNGDFSSGWTGWVDDSTSWSITGGEAVWNDAAGNYVGELASSENLVVGEFYKVSFDYDIQNPSELEVYVTAGGKDILYLNDGSATFEGYILATATTPIVFSVEEYSGGSMTMTIDNVKIEKSSDGYALPNTKYLDGKISGDALFLDVDDLYYEGRYGNNIEPSEGGLYDLGTSWTYRWQKSYIDKMFTQGIYNRFGETFPRILLGNDDIRLIKGSNIVSIVSGGIRVNDNYRYYLGDAGDWQFYYDGTDARMRRAIGTGDFIIENGALKVEEDLNVSGVVYESNISKAYAQTAYHNETDPLVIDLVTEDVYENITGLHLDYNNSIYMNGQATIGKTNMYHLTGSISFNGGNSGVYRYNLFVNDAEEHACGAMRTTTSSSIGSMSLNCLVYLEEGDVVNMRVKDTTSPVQDVNIYTLTLNMVEI